MSVLAICLVLLSAVTHAAWNLLGKATSSTPAFFCLACFAVALLMSPLLVWIKYFESSLAISLSSYFWLLLCISGAFQMIYMVSLAYAYQHADVAVVYPIARALPVLTVAALSSMMGLQLPTLAWLGMLLVTLGCLLVPLGAIKHLHWRQYANIGCCWAVIAAIGTAGYSVVDKQALNLLTQAYSGHLPAPLIALYYLGLQFVASAIWLAAGLIWQPYRREMAAAWAFNKQAALAGIMMGITYGLVLYAMTMTENISYIVALRQTSIPIGVCLAIFILREKVYISRLLGTALIFIGLICTSV